LGSNLNTEQFLAAASPVPYNAIWVRIAMWISIVEFMEVTPRPRGFVVVEPFNRKERTAAATDLHEDDLFESLNALLAQLAFDPITLKALVH